VLSENNRLQKITCKIKKAHRWLLRSVCAGDRLFRLQQDFVTYFIIKAPSDVSVNKG